MEVTELTYKEVWELLYNIIKERDDPIPLLMLLDLIEPGKDGRVPGCVCRKEP